MRRDVISREDGAVGSGAPRYFLSECLCNLLRLFTAMFKINRSHGAHSMKRSGLTHMRPHIISSYHRKITHQQQIIPNRTANGAAPSRSDTQETILKNKARAMYVAHALLLSHHIAWSA